MLQYLVFRLSQPFYPYLLFTDLPLDMIYFNLNLSGILFLLLIYLKHYSDPLLLKFFT
jgi:hypothetical protein